jgi:hypothetical protein
MVAQRVVIRDVFQATAKVVHALRAQAAHVVADACSTPAGAEHARCRAGQADSVIDLPEQQRTAVADHVTVVKRRLHDAASNLAKRHLHIGTRWKKTVLLSSCFF